MENQTSTQGKVPQRQITVYEVLETIYEVAESNPILCESPILIAALIGEAISVRNGCLCLNKK
jgi:hypothetical protein